MSDPVKLPQRRIQNLFIVLLLAVFAVSCILITGAKTFLISSSRDMLSSSKVICFKYPITGFPVIDTEDVMPSFCVMSTSPVISLSRVVFPQPLRPTTAIFSFLFLISNCIFSSTISAPY